ncbi:MAG: type III-B CRISPR module RAMP protein Cmr6, partial [Armatimonadetes bacterium]|nr:type III-B CRISPR module RAMP protein Cmr6 [Armatimonadota bacterium]
WDRNLGVPYLPGSSVKGMARAWAQYWGAADENTVTRIFGPRGQEKLWAGSVIFFDAFPTTWPEIEIDIMNPHYQEYYTDPSKPPGDWMQPNPIFFLTVKQGQEFEFAVAKRTPGTDDSDVQQAVQLLKDALEYLGAGSKTAVGYGHFTQPTEVDP